MILHKTCLNFPQYLWDKLKERSKQTKRSLTQELMHILEKELKNEPS